ncbi:helix-turn-helix domain-containing protein [Abyssalbus ytuae]|uniref:Helix-turn-helix transcriptional regulator n=1 Tax=Abyssalbus ytuae TaxID=2926907 RepID=A0A9E7D3I0_9FLAO|nr:helix-turn-helix transcriptional regulator [Abyssalbus ytuae]UOB17874.1 helix-turn-helix transcriptional regulator [Abyssalbus ytuae]
MSINNIKNKLLKTSKKDTAWLEKAKWRKENEEWLDISFKIAVKILSALKTNKATGTYPKSQKELAKALDCSPQYISKLLKGQERLGIDTITKVGKILSVKLIEVPQEEIEKEGMLSSEDKFTVTIKAKELMHFNYHFGKFFQDDNELCFDYSEIVETSTYVRPNTKHLKVA